VSSLPPFLDARDERPALRRALREWIALQAACVLHPAPAVRRLRAGESPAEVLRALAATAGAGAPFDPDAALACLARLGARALPLDSPAYPERLVRLDDPAPLLFVLGAAEALAGRSVAVVGARAATAYGRRVAGEIGAVLARSGVVVVSGLAYGVDAQAHRAALDAGGLAVAILGCGPETVYPAAHRALAARVAARGALVTEFPPGFPALPHHFPHRNRLIAGLAECVVVVEARARSGSLSTAGRAGALAEGRVFAVPGPIDAPASAGTNRLIRDGAHVYTEPDDLLQRLGLPLVGRPPQARPSGGGGGAVLAALRDAPATPDELVRRLGRTPEALAADLVRLELEGRVARDADGCLRVVS
jgi:DNA processing protein